MATELSDLTGVGPKTEGKLNSVGIDSLDDLAESSVEEIVESGLTEQKAEKLLQRAEEYTIQIQSSAERQSEYDERNTVSTGIDELDAVLDGGWLEEDVVCVYGRSDSGKSQLAFKSIAAATESRNQPGIYIETEKDNYQPSRIQDFATDDTDAVLNDTFAIRAKDLDQQLNAYSAVSNRFESASIVVVDSFNSHFRHATGGRGDLSQRSQQIGLHMREIEDMAETLSCPVLLVAQIYDAPEMRGRSDIPYGGNVFLHEVRYKIHVKPDSGDLRRAILKGHSGLDDGEVQLNITGDDILGRED